jgi:glutamine amidotransferase
MDVTVVDYLGNLGSVLRALLWLGAKVELTDSPGQILDARHLILPGDGAFGYGMAELASRGLVGPILEFIAAGGPFLGICLGMQLLLSESEEFGRRPGLGVIPGRVVPFPQGPFKVPHIGWSPIRKPADRAWDATVLGDLHEGDSAYFIHSFVAVPDNPAHTLAETEYGGVTFSSVIAQANVTGCQFHPEKSGPVGLRILKRFLELPTTR